MNLVKRTVSITLAAVLLTALCVFVLAAQPGFDNFTYSGKYSPGQFRDVNGSEWFAQYVEDGYNFGFFKGKSGNIFDHGGFLTLGEAVTLASRLRSIYHTGRADFAESVPFYSVYVDYALSYGIIGRGGNYNTPVTRSVFAELIYNALPPEAFPEINTIADYGICDVMQDADFADAVYTLYSAGILAGSDRFGTFFPVSNITRAEACTIMVRVANPSTRVKTNLPANIPAETIFQRSVNSVFMLETFDVKGKTIRTKSNVAVDRTQTEIRKVFFQLPVYPFSRGMGGDRAKFF